MPKRASEGEHQRREDFEASQARGDGEDSENAVVTGDDGAPIRTGSIPKASGEIMKKRRVIRVSGSGRYKSGAAGGGAAAAAAPAAIPAGAGAAPAGRAGGSNPFGGVNLVPASTSVAATAPAAAPKSNPFANISFAGSAAPAPAPAAAAALAVAPAAKIANGGFGSGSSKTTTVATTKNGGGGNKGENNIRADDLLNIKFFDALNKDLQKRDATDLTPLLRQYCKYGDSVTKILGFEVGDADDAVVAAADDDDEDDDANDEEGDGGSGGGGEQGGDAVMGGVTPAKPILAAAAAASATATATAAAPAAAPAAAAFSFGSPAPAPGAPAPAPGLFGFGAPAPPGAAVPAPAPTVGGFNFGPPAPAAEGAAAGPAPAPNAAGVFGGSSFAPQPAASAPAAATTTFSFGSNPKADPAPAPAAAAAVGTESDGFAKDDPAEIGREENNDEDILLEVKAKYLKLVEGKWKAYATGNLRLYRNKTDKSKCKMVMRDSMGKVLLNLGVSKGMMFTKNPPKKGKGSVAFVAVQDQEKGAEKFMLMTKADNHDALHSKLVELST
mmetsp:Transcript_18323/g.40740  ORF Transcript_18323/g.40740 Transcript_18323/m.40740 type:complete len:556 (+) Transcript_18323:192-1859(+)